MADEIIYVTVTPAVTEIVEVESFVPESILVNVKVNEVFNGVSFLQDTEPDFPETGNTWYNPTTNRLYVKDTVDWRNPGLDLIVEGTIVSRATSLGDRMWTVQIGLAQFDVPVLDGVVFGIGTKVKIFQEDLTPKLIVGTVGSAEYTGCGPWVDVELVNGFTNVSGLQHLQWRSEGSRRARFRGHVIGSGHSTRRMANLPPNAETAFLKQMLAGVGQNSSDVSQVARIDLWGPASGIFADVAGGYQQYKTFSLNTRYMSGRLYSTSSWGGGSNVSPWVFYNTPWPIPVDEMLDGRVLLSGLLKSGPAGTSTIYQWAAAVDTLPRASGGTWILAQQQAAANSIARFDAFSTADRIDITEVTNSGYVSIDGIEWVTAGGAVAHPFIECTLVNGFVNYGSGYATAAYTKFGDSVYLRGLVTGGSGNDIITTLPEEHRPPQTMRHLCVQAGVGNSTTGQVEIRPDGTVRLFGIRPSAGNWISLSGISFSTTP